MIYHNRPHFISLRLLRCALAAWGVVQWSAELRADQLVTNDENIPGVSVTGLADGGLSYQATDNAVRTVPLADVQLIFIDQVRTLSDFNEAERLVLDKKFDEAIVRYARARRLADSFWLDLIEIRLAQAYDRAAQIDKAVEQWLKLIDRPTIGPTAAARLVPSNIPTRRTVAASTALALLATAYDTATVSEQRTLLSLVRFDILQRSGDGRAAAGAREAIQIDITKPLRCNRLYEIQLSALTLAIRKLVDTVFFSAVDRAIATCPRPLVPSFLLLKGDALLQKAKTRDDLIRASWPYMHVVAMVPTDKRTADALYRTANIVAQLGRSQKARQLLQECLDHRRVSPKIRRKAKTALKQLSHSAKGDKS